MVEYGIWFTTLRFVNRNKISHKTTWDCVLTDHRLFIRKTYGKNDTALVYIYNNNIIYYSVDDNQTGLFIFNYNIQHGKPAVTRQSSLARGCSTN